MESNTEKQVKDILEDFFKNGTKGDYLSALNEAVKKTHASDNSRGHIYTCSYDAGGIAM